MHPCCVKGALPQKHGRGRGGAPRGDAFRGLTAQELGKPEPTFSGGTVGRPHPPEEGVTVSRRQFLLAKDKSRETGPTGQPIGRGLSCQREPARAAVRPQPPSVSLPSVLGSMPFV